MIKTVSDFLNKLREKENEILKKQNITHKPTIGDMYEGLTKSLLAKAFPDACSLNIVSGFISDEKGNLSNELDCMVVIDDGECVPYTNKRKFIIDDVIAVVQVKKNLYSNDLQSGYANLLSVNDFKPTRSRSITLLQDAFQSITRRPLPERGRLSELPIQLQMIYHILVVELMRPVRIILGYNGFSSEASLRQSFIDFLAKKSVSGNVRGFGAASFPSLIVCGSHSLLKINGMPYACALRDDGYWPFYASSSRNPLEIILNLIWTRLVYADLMPASVFDDDMTKEAFAGFIETKFGRIERADGWIYRWTEVSDEVLKAPCHEQLWEPAFLDLPQFVVINRLCNEGELDITDVQLKEFLENYNYTPKSLFDSLNKVGLVGLDNNKLVLLTRGCSTAILPDGKFVAAENVSGQLSRWIINYVPDLNTRQSSE